MSSFAVTDFDGTLVGIDELTKEVRDALNEAREARKAYEGTWYSNMAFAAGKYWLKWDRFARTLQMPEDLMGKDLYSADVITEYRTTALGEMGTDDDRPELLLRRDDEPSEDFQEQLNKAVGWGWDYEWKGDEALEIVRQVCLDLGTAGIRCRFDSTQGPVIAENVPFYQGKPIRSMAQAAEIFASGPTEDVEMRDQQQGRILWETLSPFNMIVPPGVPHERDFPWEAIIRPVSLKSARKEFGDALGDIKEDTDIGSLLGMDTSGEQSDTSGLAPGAATGKQQRLRGHIWLVTYYERPCPEYPKGRTIYFAGNRMKPVRLINELPYQAPDGSYTSGIAYFHWWRVTGRFWGRGLVEALKDPQRSINKRKTQIHEIIDRGLPAIFVEHGSKAKSRRGLVNELIELGKQENAPVVFPGVNPGQWMADDIEGMREDLVHASGIRGPRLGENPENVVTYAQLALLNENDQVKRMAIQREHRLSIAKLVESSVYDIRTYWGHERQVAIAGDEGDVEAFQFNASVTPTFFMVKVAKGSSKPRSQAAELKKIEDLWNAAMQAGVLLGDPQSWVEWRKDSMEQGQALDLPRVGGLIHEDKARMENAAMKDGQPAFVQYYDPSALHIPIHREEQVRAELSGDTALWAAIEAHVQDHVIQDMETAMQMNRMVPEPLPDEEQMGGGETLQDPEAEAEGPPPEQEAA